ncbi:MAG TPA: signal peptidase I [Acidimicrobiia bacterium]|nr:signal peptidase I [Acidimicrobiia bacterium]
MRWALPVAIAFGLGACTSAGMSVGRSAGVSAAGVSFATAGSCSMFPAFKPGDRLRFDRNVGEPQRGDIVSYRATFGDGQSQEMVHRVVGLPGERLEPAPDGGVLVNGAPLVEPYLPAGLTTYLPELVEVPADHWFLLGDNRERSSDSRVSGAIPRADILTKLTKVESVKSEDEDSC